VYLAGRRDVRGKKGEMKVTRVDTNERRWLRESPKDINWLAVLKTRTSCPNRECASLSFMAATAIEHLYGNNKCIELLLLSSYFVVQGTRSGISAKWCWLWGRLFCGLRRLSLSEN